MILRRAPLSPLLRYSLEKFTRSKSGTPGEAGVCRHRAFTLLEVLLTTAIAVLLLASLYVAFDLYINATRIGREEVQQATVARAVLDRISDDITSSLALCDPSRYRNQAESSSTTDTPPEEDSEPEVTGDEGGDVGTLLLPLGVQGGINQLAIYTTKLPHELYKLQPDQPLPVVSDQRRITYWMVPGEENQGGLARREEKIITADALQNLMLPESDLEGDFILAPEVRSVEFAYFDGTVWNEFWDSSAPGADDVTPLGPPRLIAITLGVASPRRKGDEEEQIKYYRRVVAIPTADGLPLSTTAAQAEAS